ncbi:MAG: saccharopine dehydrogenase NADP-binding domain-containing protein [Calditrichaeota bacterium]|nr:saccharopine dehydrogenase NADP-binding domain-containing protein [Calditrichota bacterium]HQU71798.1 saccharopine dehydrogenase C-terminal domain-containing protein [Calditrichia bacterium]
MKRILVLGAGQSAPYMIDYLLNIAQENDWFITVGDLNVESARKVIRGHSRGNAIAFDINDAAMRDNLFQSADLVVNFLSPTFQYLIALESLNHNTSMVSASYELPRVKALEPDCLRRGIIILNEMGLDPGIDHMSAMALINRIRANGGSISSFVSYGSGIPAPGVNHNPLRYCITWNPRNVVRAGEVGAQYMETGEIKVLPHHHVFHRTWQVKVDGVGTLEAYPNRNSLVYQSLFGLENVHTMIRGTLRWPGWSETWQQVVKLGIYNDSMEIPGLPERTYREFIQMFLPLHSSGSQLEQRVANFLQINPTGRIMENLTWLGLFEDQPIGGNVRTAGDVMTNLLIQKMPLPPGERDMVILSHEMVVDYPDQDRSEKIISTMVEYGVPDGFTAISKTVGLPAAIAVKLILNGELPLTGVHIPTHPAIYEPVLRELEEAGIVFVEKAVPLGRV